ncbi:hypothetical protein HAX54_016504 [Datura stramonium]|uniref:Uncharacterized protein n=1 Tax=Datura stramonium TaxID=4076 RepID=A0ABS8Y2Y6_DATST|nr:hypothetical protein [Datura stramonium]
MSGPKWPKASKHFVIVHGAYRGAWSWYKLLASLKTSGHNVTALDLGTSGINPKQVLEVPHLSDIMKFMTSPPADEKLVIDLALATTVLRSLYTYSVEDVSKEIVLSSKRYGSVRRVFIVAAEDKLLRKEFQQRMIEKNPPDEVKEIQGSDHMVMMSKPLQLCNLLLSIGHK